MSKKNKHRAETHHLKMISTVGAAGAAASMLALGVPGVAMATPNPIVSPAGEVPISDPVQPGDPESGIAIPDPEVPENPPSPEDGGALSIPEPGNALTPVTPVVPSNPEPPAVVIPQKPASPVVPSNPKPPAKPGVSHAAPTPVKPGKTGMPEESLLLPRHHVRAIKKSSNVMPAVQKDLANTGSAAETAAILAGGFLTAGAFLVLRSRRLAKGE